MDVKTKTVVPKRKLDKDIEMWYYQTLILHLPFQSDLTLLSVHYFHWRSERKEGVGNDERKQVKRESMQRGEGRMKMGSREGTGSDQDTEERSVRSENERERASE